MVKLERPPEPDSLIRSRTKWTNRWNRIRQQGQKLDWATAGAKSALRQPLLLLAYGKCAFCESKLNVTSFVEIEHYHAKTIRPDLAFDWQNLFPSCGRCNNRKNELDHQGRLLKPDVDDPEDFLWLHPDSGELQPHPNLDATQAKRVRETIEAYGLQRGALCVERIERMEFVQRWLARTAREQPNLSGECEAEWQYLIHPSTPWKFVIRHVLTQKGSPELAQMDRQVHRRRL